MSEYLLPDAELDNGGKDFNREIAWQRLSSHLGHLAIDSGVIREHQHTALEDTLAWISTPNEDGSDKSGYIQMATGAGKTVTFIELINGLRDEAGRPPRTLILVNKINLLQQTVGDTELGEKGFAQFAPDLEVSSYYGGSKDLKGDVVIMTYSSFNRMRKNDLLEDDFPLLILDEAHRALGEKNRANITRLHEGPNNNWLTATPDFGNSKHVKRLLPDAIHELTIQEAMSLGVIMRPQAWAYRTEAVLHSTTSGDYSDEELGKLIELESRNTAALEFAKVFIEKGLQGAITALPGKSADRSPLAHARKLEILANATEILDAQTGATRNIRASAIGGHMDESQLDKIYRDFRTGNIDLLIGVDLINEGFDAPNLKFLINTRPTRSRVLAEQRIGRVLRIGESTPQIVEFVDSSNKPQITIFNILNVDTFKQGDVIGPSVKRLGDGAANTNSTRKILDLSDDLSHLIDTVQTVLVDELIPAAYDNIPEGYLNRYQLQQLLGVGWNTIQKIISELDLQRQNSCRGSGMEST